ncbi:hypothetical protein KP79_PYT04290 [Mizuhopecten yessoensis]|uniref:Methyltransferase type 11 domain-containing protein n=1 Tax=Mizuhopecten yessoensis TaxID=6573 RepID=A0A210PU02_MIZYE|nr:hypothetical protein KP79_PYT04290 [Mizuhopecten yessoensis]
MNEERRGSLKTASDGDETFNFDGVFRDVNDKNTRVKLYSAQASVKDGKWTEAETILNETIKSLSEGHDQRNLKLVLREIERYQKFHIAMASPAVSGINWIDVCERKPEMYFEKFDELPQSIFTLKNWRLAENVLVGRRLLSHQWIANKIRELHCSHVRAGMLLGVLVDQRVQEDGILVYYYPLTAKEKRFYMHDVVSNHLRDIELVFPFPPLQSIMKTEIHCPDEGWEIDEKLALQLGEGEVFLREYSVKFLKSLGREDLFLFDPACSTGQFLSTMKAGLPNCFTFGQDLSSCMVKYAKNRVDEARCANALDPQVPDETADVEFVRFINSEVVKAKEARIMIEPLLKPLKTGGYMITFGHTPVLVSAADFKMSGRFEIMQCVGGDPEWDGIFQYYVCKKI